MVLDEQKQVNSTAYKDYNSHLSKMCDLLEIFVYVNKEIVNKEDDKIKRRRRTNRFKISNLFRDTTKALIRIQQLMQEIKVTPVTGVTSPITLWDYYLVMGDFERLAHDTKIIKNGTKNTYVK